MTSKVAVTDARFSFARTSPASARAPIESPSASNKIDFPAPVSPVRTLSPPDNSRSKCSMRTIFLTFSALSIARSVCPSPKPAQPRRFLPLRRKRILRQQSVTILVPRTAWIVISQYGRCHLRFISYTEGQIRFSHAM